EEAVLQRGESVKRAQWESSEHAPQVLVWRSQTGAPGWRQSSSSKHPKHRLPAQKGAEPGQSSLSRHWTQALSAGESAARQRGTAPPQPESVPSAGLLEEAEQGMQTLSSQTGVSEPQSSSSKHWTQRLRSGE